MNTITLFLEFTFVFSILILISGLGLFFYKLRVHWIILLWAGFYIEKLNTLIINCLSNKTKGDRKNDKN